MTHRVTLVSLYTHAPFASFGFPFASIALDVRAGAPPSADDWPDNNKSAGYQQWRDDSDVLASETLGDATHAQLVFMLACYLLQRESLFEVANEVVIECGWPAMHTALASESWDFDTNEPSTIFVWDNAEQRFFDRAAEQHHAQYTRACAIAQKCFADAIKHVAALRVEDAALEARLRDSDLGVSMNIARGWLYFKRFATHSDSRSSVSEVNVNDSELSVDIEQCKS